MDLVKLARNQADKLSGTKYTLAADLHINIAPLQIATDPSDPSQVDETDHFHHKKDFVARSRGAPSGNIRHSDLFNAAKANAKSVSGKYTTSKTAQDEYEMVHGNIVCVTAQAGMGKTTLSKLLVQKIISKNLYDVDCIFYLRFRDIDYKNNMNLLQFLTDNSTFASTITGENLTEVLRLLDNNDRVALILDGFDEAALEQIPLGKCNILSTTKAEIFIINIISGNILPRAKKLITSRPGQFYNLPHQIRPSFIVKILGLNRCSQRRICEDICENKSKYSETVFKFACGRPYLQSYCYVPVNCVLIMYSIFRSLLSGGLKSLDKLDSITTLLVVGIHMFIEHKHLRGSVECFQVKELSEMAYTAFKAKRLQFKKIDMERAGINKENASAFFNYTMAKHRLKLLDGSFEHAFYFTHLMLQEYFTALRLRLYSSVEEVEAIVDDLVTDRYEMVTKFLFGLCNPITVEYLSELVPLEGVLRNSNLKVVCIMKNIAKQSLDLTCNPIDSFLTLKSRHDRLGRTFDWLHELQDDSFTSEAVDELRSVFRFFPNEFSFVELPAFIYALKARSMPLRLALGNLPHHIEVELISAFENTHIQIVIQK